MSVLVTLRTRTRDAHDRLEDGLDVLHHCGDRSSYAALLAAFHSVVAPLERALTACPATPVALPDWSARCKTPWLEQDLRDLGATPWPAAAVPALVTAEDVVGTAYVLEGATLGGAVVVRQLPADLPRRYFTSYGDERGARWRAFRSHVEQLPVLDDGAVVGAAERTFGLFELACLGVRR